MSQVVLDAIRAATARLTPVASAPAQSFGYGTDISCAEDLTESMEEVDGLTTQGLAESVVRRLSTPRGSLPDVRGLDLRDGDYGIDVASYLNRGLTRSELESLGSIVRSEVTKDDRVLSLVVTVTPHASGTALALDLRVTPRDPRLVAFDLVLSASSAGVLLEELRGGAG